MRIFRAVVQRLATIRRFVHSPVIEKSVVLCIYLNRKWLDTGITAGNDWAHLNAVSDTPSAAFQMHHVDIVTYPWRCPRVSVVHHSMC